MKNTKLRKKTNRKLIKTISVILSILMIFTVIPIVVRAEETSVQQDNSDTVEETPVLVNEIIEKREFDTKHFLMSDGSIVAAKYTVPVHYQDENGNLQDVDNSLSEEADFETGENQLTNKSNTFDVKFSKKSNGNKLVTLKKDDHKVSWGLIGARKVSAEHSDPAENQSNDPMILEKLTSSVKYSDILKSVDIVYSVDAYEVKENIVIKDENAPESFPFSYKVNNLDYRTTEDGNIELYDKKSPSEIVFIIEKPYMYDVNKAYSEDIEMLIEETNKGFEITLTPDREWINDAERAYPIVIDPPTTSSTVRSDIWDIDMMQNQSQMFSCNAEDLVVGVDDLGRVFRSVIKFNGLPTLDTNTTIVSSKLNITAYQGMVKEDDVALRPRPSGNPIVNIHRVNDNWPETTDWNATANDYDRIVEDYFVYNATDTNFQVDITKVTSGWYSGTYDNYGIMLKSADETTTNRAMQFTSSDWGYEEDVYKSYRPVLIINYRNTLGLEDYWSYTTQDLGQYGTGYVNNYSGNLVYIHEDASFNSLINGFSLSHIYNSGSTNNGMGYYGRGWRLNLVQKLESVSVNGNSSVKQLYTDGDGTKHYFIEKSDGAIVDEDGLGYTYSTINEGELKKQLTHKDGTVLKFDYLGYLRVIIDSNGNTVNLHYAPIPNVDNYLSAITTSSGGTYRLGYDSNYKLTTITDNASRITEFSYTGENLTSIKYPDGTRVAFEYCQSTEVMGTSIYWLHGIISPDGSQLRYSNYGDSGKIFKTKTISKNGTIGETLTFNYDYNQTYITDSNGYKLTYQFDTVGRPIGVYDNYDNIYSQTYTVNVTDGSGIFKNNKLEKSTNETVYVNNLLTNPVFSNDFSGWIQYNPIIMDIEIVSDCGLLSNKSVKIHNYTPYDTYLKQNVTASSGGTYTLSGYIKASDMSYVTKGAGLCIVTSENRYIYSELIKNSTNIENDNGFQFLSATVNLAESETISYISAGIYEASGTVWIDSLQLEEGESANPINFITNSSFEQNSNGSTAANGFTNNANGKVSSQASKNGSNSFCINGNALQDYNITQTFNISGNEGDVYSFGAYVKATAVPRIDENTKSTKFAIVFNCTDGTSQWQSIEYNSIITNWQFGSDVIIAKKPYSSITAKACYYDNCNTAYFDNLFLYRDTMQSYRYDNNGNVVSTYDYAQQNDNFKYEGNNLASLISPDGSGYEYLYDDKNNIISSRSSDGLSYDIDYDNQGNAVSAVASSHNYSSSLQRNTAYYIRLGGSGKYLTVENSGTENGTNVIQANFSGSANQRWIVTSTTDGGYTLSPEHSANLCLDVTGMNNADLSNVAVYQNNGSAAQTFFITPQSTYNYRLSPKCSSDGKVLTVCFSQEQNNVTIYTSQGNNNRNQSWFFESVLSPPDDSIANGSVYMLRTRNSGQYLTVADNGVTAGTKITQNHMNMGDEQKFRIEEYENSGYYTLTPLNAPNMLAQVSTEASETYGSVYLQIGDNTVTDRKLFKFEYDSSYKGFLIIPKYDENRALDVANYSCSPGVDLLFTGKRTDINRIFIAERISDSIVSSATYQDNGNYPHTVTDALGNTTTYGYDFSRGIQTSVTDAKNNTTTYQYNSLNDRLNSVTSAGKTVSYEYDTVGAIKKITSPGGTVYNLNYDEFGRTSNISVGSKLLSATEYKDNKSGLISKLTYGNGAYREYGYDALKRLTSESINGTITKKYLYDKQGNTAQISDLVTGVITKFRYDLIGRISGIKASNGHEINYFYDEYNRIKKYRYSNNITDFYTEFTYGNNPMFIRNDGYIYYVSLNGEVKLSYNYDELGRLTTRTVNANTPFTTEYTYMDGATQGTTSTVIKTIKNGNDTLEYDYDQIGNITSVTKNGTVSESYTYDALSQLLTAEVGGTEYEYTYDNGGNITQVKEDNIVTKSYTYGDAEWKDLLTAYNGQTITYDGIGNPLTYRDGYTFTWSGRQLTSVSKDGELIATYTYDADGNRTSKTVNGVTTNYYWLNGVLQSEYTNGISLVYLYDETGRPYGYAIDNLGIAGICYYVYNQQGDVIAIRDEYGEILAEYTYGPYGETTMTSSADPWFFELYLKNPLRYRGYYYDAETGFYLTGTRYYDPAIGRFINADGQINDDILGTNLFAYCGNNPVTRADDTGRGWWVVAGAIIGGIAGGVAKIVSNVITGKEWNEGVIGATVGGAVYGGVLAATGNVWAAGFASAAAESLTNEVVSYIPKVSQANGQTVTKKVTTGNVIDSTKTVLNDTAVNGTISTVTGKIAGKIVPTNNGWFKPQKFVSSFAGEYAIKSELQTLTQSGLLFGVEGLKYSFNQRLKQGQQPIVTFFPDTEIRAAG